MRFEDLFLSLYKDTEIGIVVNGKAPKICEPDEYPSEYLDMTVDMITAVGKYQILVYLTDNTPTHLLDTDSAEGRCLGDISE